MNNISQSLIIYSHYPLKKVHYKQRRMAILLKIENTELQQVRQQLLSHPIYQAMTSPERVRVFMKHHVFAVWDFMSLAKRLQISLTSTQIPWMPNKNAKYARFINEIILGEETDEDGKGSYASHFQLYIQAMEEVGADTHLIDKYLNQIESGVDVIQALEKIEIPSSISQFVQKNLELALHGKIHEVTSAFFFGREDLIPDMFTVLLQELNHNQQSTENLEYYLQRHIELDGDQHGPLAEKLLASLCGTNDTYWQESKEIAITALRSRIELWDGVLAEIHQLDI